MITIQKIVLLPYACAAAIALTGCLGGDGDPAPPPAPIPVTSAVPDSASASVDGYIAYLMALVVAPADALEPVAVTNVTPPTLDTTEPVTLN